jgi:hypothetical protein
MLLALIGVFSLGTQSRHIVALNPHQPEDGVLIPAQLWNDTRCFSIMTPTAQDKFKAIQYGPYKSDLCRLFVMSKFGGVYTDQDVWLEKEPTGHVLVMESPLLKKGKDRPYIMNAVMVSDANNPLFERAIKIMLHTNENDKWRRGLWGPWALWKADPSNFTILQEQCRGSSPCTCGYTKLFKSHKPCRY